jgi:hypothetical protein
MRSLLTPARTDAREDSILFLTLVNLLIDVSHTGVQLHHSAAHRGGAFGDADDLLGATVSTPTVAGTNVSGRI